MLDHDPTRRLRPLAAACVLFTLLFGGAASADPNDFLIAAGMSDADRVGERRTIVLCEIDITSGRGRFLGARPRVDGTCVRTIPRGWALVNYRTEIISNNNGSYTVDVLHEGTDLALLDDLRRTFRSAIDAALEAGDHAAAASLEEQYEETLRLVMQYSVNLTTFRAHAWAQSACTGCRGWFKARWIGELEYIGGGNPNLGGDAGGGASAGGGAACVDERPRPDGRAAMDAMHLPLCR